ncbi:hypothetical protein [Mycobacterium sp. E2989]|uniref:hypothetical protein n=1 Tax=Mycobacterium sp. E2989 TaxID=1834140 RepID=UPI0007FC17AD|nr:hypothetical protein [Mycobacterium sp. E2989]OBH86159.1 hypothetical protein A5680_06095 [Mycobacterium sp. E2989]
MRWYARPEGQNHQLRVAPRLFSGEKFNHPEQIQLRAFLDDTEALLAGSRIDGPWALRLDVGLSSSLDLLDKRDLDNYAKPLASRLKDDGLVSVWCTKQQAEKSFVWIEAAREMPAPSTDVLLVTTTASWEAHAAQEQIRAAAADGIELPAGPVRLQLAFVVGPSRNWLNLWKPTIDSLGSFLGHEQPFRAWNPRDGRVTELGMHLAIDPALRNDVMIGISATGAGRDSAASQHPR